MLNDRTTAQLVEKNCLANRLFTRPDSGPATGTEAASADRRDAA